MIVLGLSVLIGIAFVVGMLFAFTDVFESDSDDDSENSSENSSENKPADAIAQMAALAAASNTTTTELPTTTTMPNAPVVPSVSSPAAPSAPAISMNPTTPLTSAPLAIEPSGGCDDVPPAWWASNPTFKDYTCAQFKDNAEGCALMVGSCRRSCGKCGDGSAAVSGNSNSDIPPSWAPNTCAEIKQFGGCSEEYMKGFCLKSCGSGGTKSAPVTQVTTQSFAASSGPQSVLAIGDSLTDQDGLPGAAYNWTNMLQAKGNIQLQKVAKYGYTANMLLHGIFPSRNTSFKPTYATIMLGSNEAINSVQMNEFDGAYKQMMESVWSTSPNTTFIMMKIPKLNQMKFPGTAQNVATMNQKIKSIYDGYHNSGKHVKLLDINAAITDTMFEFDGVHLNAMGDQTIADLVYSAMNSSDM